MSGIKAIFLLLIFLSVSRPFLKAEEKDSGELSLPWNAFEKLLRLDRDDVVLTWDEFQRLIRQTGVEETPNFQMQDGNVVLGRSEFKKLLDRMKSHPREAAKYFLTKGAYSGRIGAKSAAITAQIRLQIPGRAGEMDPLRIPLFPGHMAFKEILLNGRPAWIENDGSRMYVTVTEPGNHEISATFSTPNLLDRSPHQLSFPVPRTPITQLNLTLPMGNAEIQVSNAAQTEVIKKSGETQVKAFLPPTDSISLTWTSVLPEREKGPAKIYAVVYNLLSIEEDALRARASVELDVLQNTITSLNLQVPEKYNVLDVQGEAVGEWKVRGEDPPVLVIPLQYGRIGKFYVTITAEQLFSGRNRVTNYDGFKVLSAVRERGFVGVERKTSGEVKATGLKEVDRMDIQEMPQALLNLSNRPLTDAFKYSRQPYELTLDIQRHEEVAVISTVVDEANGVTLVMEDGKRIHHLTYRVRNHWKQFLELSLPDQAELWSVFVEGQKVTASKNAKGRLLIPLNRSRLLNGDLSSFDIEMMFYHPGHLSPAGQMDLQFPVPDVVVSQMLWSVYLPVQHDYLYVGGNLDKEKDAQGFKPLVSVLSGKQRVLRDLSGAVSQNVGLYRARGPASEDMQTQRVEGAKKTEVWQHRGSFSEAQSVDENMYARQVERELSFFGQVQQHAGMQEGGGDARILPIRVQVPKTGQVFRFTKRIIVDQASLRLKVIHAHGWIVKLFKGAVVLALAALLVKHRIKILSLNKDLVETLQKHKEKIQWVVSPAGSAVGALVLTILFSFVSRLLSVVAFLFFLGGVARLLWARLEARRNS